MKLKSKIGNKTSKNKEILTLLWLNFKVKISNFVEFARVFFLYYRCFRFAKIDSTLLFSYLFDNPFSIAKRYLIQKREKEVYTYGETPLTTLEYIANRCSLSSFDVVYELGCGRGRTCFWLEQFVGCSVVGIDHVPAFIEKANQIKERFQIDNVTFRQENLLFSNFMGATVIYFYGTCSSTKDIQQLIHHMKKLPIGTKVITVSYALKEIEPEAPFEVMDEFIAKFTWGKAMVYLQIKNNPLTNERSPIRPFA